MVKNRALLPWWFIGISKARFVVKVVILPQGELEKVNLFSHKQVLFLVKIQQSNLNTS